MRLRPRLLLPLILAGLVGPGIVAGQDVPRAVPRSIIPRSHGHFGSSPFTPPEPNDQTFIVDEGSGLDTGCSYHSEGPLVFTVEIGRVLGDKARLLAEGLIPETVRLEMPAFDIDSEAVIEDISPERDRVTFNGQVVPTEFLRGANDTWRQNAFDIPIEWVNFATANGTGAPTPGLNTISIDIDVANSSEQWCMSIDWAALSVQAPRPVVLAHGILSNSGTWSPTWTSALSAWGIPFANDLNLGALDSIQDNAAEIAAKVAEYKTRFGVDRVVIVAHSKGGLDSRHFVEQSDDVEQLIQLGTPNAGSPLADLVQAGLIAGLGLGNAAIVNALAGPAGVQLTRPYMAAYNMTHGHNANVRYTALAGDYDPDCSFFFPICRPLDQALLLITGRGDTIVPVSSVHALSYTHDRTFPSSGGDPDAKHTFLTKSGAVLSEVQDRTRAPGTPLARSTSTPPSLPQRTATIAGTVAGGALFVSSLPIDTAGRAFVVLMYPEGQLDLTLESPDGTTIDPTWAATAPEVEYDDGDCLGGRAAIYAFDPIAAGTWMVRVTGTSVPAGGDSPFTVQAWLPESPLRFVGLVSEPYRQLGQPLVLAADCTRDETAVSAVVVQATVALPDDSLLVVPLVDDGVAPDGVAGDGRFTGQIASTAQAGLHRIRFSAEGTDPQAPFTREDFGLATVSASTTAIAGSFSESTVDLDGDGFYDELRIAVPLDVTAARTYRLHGGLRDSAGNIHEADAVGDLPVGPGQLVLRFAGEALFANAVDGPYVLESVLVAEEEDIALLPVTQVLDAWTTAAYAYGIFEHTPVFLTGNGSDHGVDDDGDGRFDRLAVSIEVEAETGGFYQWSARLVDAAGAELGFDAGSASFVPGLNGMTFEFPGEAIGRNGVNGPFFVRDLLLFGAGQSLVAANVYTTQAYAAGEFEGETPVTTTTTTTSSTTTTTLAGCGNGASYAAAACRVAELRDDVDATQVPITSLLRVSLDRALVLLARAEAMDAEPRLEQTLLRRCDRRLLGFVRRLRSHAGVAQLPSDVRARLIAAANGVRELLAALAAD